MRPAALIRIFVVAGLLTTGVSSKPVYAWGRVGHEIVTEAAIASMSSPMKEFFVTNKDALKRMTNVPDTTWKVGWLAIHEGPTHFFKWNEYNRSTLRDSMPLPLSKAVSMVGRKYVADNGSAVWRTSQIGDLFTTAIGQKNWREAIQMAGVLGHYIGDLAQPMHVTSDYNGQSINKPGIHARFETKLVNTQDRDELLAQVVKKAAEKIALHKTKRKQPVVDISFEQGKRSLEQLPNILKEYKRDDVRDEILIPQMVDGLAEGAATLAILWDEAFESQNVTEFPKKKLIVREPKWVSFKLTAPASIMPMDACEHEEDEKESL